jgi:hypothetical protein
MKPSQTNTPNRDEDSGEFAGFDTIDAICAYVHFKGGEAELRWLIGQVFDPNDQETFCDGWGPREPLEDAAAELERRGLDKPAAILLDLAQQAISGIDLVPDYMERAGPQFVEAWRERWRQQRHIQLGTWDQELRRRIARNQRQSQINGQKPSPHGH